MTASPACATGKSRVRVCHSQGIGTETTKFCLKHFWESIHKDFLTIHRKHGVCEASEQRRTQTHVWRVDRPSHTKLSAPGPRRAFNTQPLWLFICSMTYIDECNATVTVTLTPWCLPALPPWSDRLPPLTAFHFPFPQPPHGVTPSHSHTTSWKASHHISLFCTPDACSRRCWLSSAIKSSHFEEPSRGPCRVINRLLHLNKGSQRRLRGRFRE